MMNVVAMEEGSVAGSIDADALDRLRKSVEGGVLIDGDQAFDDARAVWNAMIDRRPAVIVRCKTTADVVAGVLYARNAGLRVSVRGGGHNVAGHAVADGAVMIDLSP